MLPELFEDINMADPLNIVRTWAMTMADRGLFASNTARFKAHALTELAKVLGSEEPRTPDYVLANIGEITRRWIVRTSANPNTGRTYETRAKTLLEDYIAYQADPKAFKGRHREAKPKTRESTSAAESTDAVEPGPQIPSGGTAHDRSVSSSDLRTYPLGNGESFRFLTPPPGLTVKDAIRFCYHLVTMASDFDPTDPTQARMFALVKRE